MTKFKNFYSIEKIRALCEERGFELDTAKYDQGWDWVTIAGSFDGYEVTFIYNGFNGRIIGEHIEHGMFTEESTELDGTPWYDEILNFVYIPADGEAA